MIHNGQNRFQHISKYNFDLLVGIVDVFKQIEPKQTDNTGEKVGSKVVLPEVHLPSIAMSTKSFSSSSTLIFDFTAATTPSIWRPPKVFSIVMQPGNIHNPLRGI